MPPWSLVPDLVTTFTKPDAAAPELGVGALGHHHHLLDRVQVEGEGRALAAALLAEERVVEVGAVHGDVVGDALLAVDGQLVAVGALHDGHAGRELREVEEVAAVVRQAAERLLVDASTPPRAWSRSTGASPVTTISSCTPPTFSMTGG